MLEDRKVELTALRDKLNEMGKKLPSWNIKWVNRLFGIIPTPRRKLRRN